MCPTTEVVILDGPRKQMGLVASEISSQLKSYMSQGSLVWVFYFQAFTYLGRTWFLLKVTPRYF